MKFDEKLAREGRQVQVSERALLPEKFVTKDKWLDCHFVGFTACGEYAIVQVGRPLERVTIDNLRMKPETKQVTVDLWRWPGGRIDTTIGESGNADHGARLLGSHTFEYEEE